MSNSLRWFGWQLRHDRGFLTFYVITLLCLFPLLTFAMQSLGEISFLSLELVILPMGCTLALACFMPAHLFAHVWNKRELDLYSSLPLKRRSLFGLRFCAGLCMAFIPLIVMIALECGILSLMQVAPYMIGILLPITAKIMAAGILLYALNVWIALHCHNRLDAIVMSTAYLLIPLILIAGVYGLIANNIDAILVCDDVDIITSLLTDNMVVRWLINLFAPLVSFGMLLSETFSAFNQDGLNMFILPPFIWAVWLLESILLTMLSCRTYIRLPYEESGQRTTHVMMYPFAIAAMTLGLFVYGVAVYDADFQRVLFIGAVFLFLILNFIAQRRVRITLKQLVTLVVLVIMSGLLQQAVVQTAGFGLVQESIPADADRYRLVISLDQYEPGQSMVMTSAWITAENDEDLIETLRSFQAEVIEDARDNDPSSWDDGKATMTIRFNYDNALGGGTRSYFLFDGDQEYLQKYRDMISQFAESSTVTTETVSESYVIE